MWKRSDLKRNARSALKNNYLKCMLAGIILLFAAGSQSVGGSSTSTVQDASDAYYESLALMEMAQDSSYPTELTNPEQDVSPDVREELYNRTQELAQNPTLRIMRRFIMGPMQVIWDSLTNILGGPGSILMTLIGFLILSPICVGGRRFFIENARQKNDQTNLSHMTIAFKDRNYMNVVMNLLLMDILIMLWSVLLVIPGIIKSYEYRMVPYLLAEHPEMKRRELFQKSKEMMYGQKWNAFLLDWSFFFWDYLSILTFGLAGIFFVYPYEHATNAELYLQLKKQSSLNEYGDSQL